jgi:predicted Zn finger-like uncharacterized protein
MGKRLGCPRCGTDNDYDVPANEATTAQRDVRCRKCGHRFTYGFRPEYVTEAEVEPREDRPSAETVDDPTDPAVALAARERLARHVARYPDYVYRDRDILLLHSLAMMERLDSELAAVKRMVDREAHASPMITSLDRARR